MWTPRAGVTWKSAHFCSMLRYQAISNTHLADVALLLNNQNFAQFRFHHSGVDNSLPFLSIPLGLAGTGVTFTAGDMIELTVATGGGSSHSISQTWIGVE